jgi:glycosyltransferase involved in cell wall biosynthesis
MALLKGLLIALCKISSGEFARKFFWPFVRKIGEYDLAIAYAQDNGWKSISKGCGDFVLKKVTAAVKAVVIHCDYRDFGGYSPKQEKTFSKFDHILCVSESCRLRFHSCFPALSDRTLACENFIDIEKIRNLSEPAVQYPADKVNFVSVCRLSVVKGLERTVRVFKNLYEQGYSDFTWTIVGDGPEYGHLTTQVKDLGLQDHIVFVGNQNNPFPYVKNADVFLLPSIHDAAPMVYGECAVLGVPVLTTETCSANELVRDRCIGRVVENSEQGLASGIKDILDIKTDLKHYAIADEKINGHAVDQFQHFLSMINDKLDI